MLEHQNVSDYGTPARESVETVTLEIDGQQVTVPKGTSIMRAAMDGGNPTHAREDRDSTACSTGTAC